MASFSSNAPWLPRPPIWLFALAASYGLGALTAGSDWTASALRRRAFTVGLGGIVLIAAVLRLWQIGGDLGHTPLDVDENRVATTVLRFFTTGEIDHRTTENYPGIGFWLLVGGDLLTDLAALMQGVARSVDGVPIERFVLGGRATSALLGTATVALTGLLGRTLGGRRSGLVAALVVAVSPLFVEISRQLRDEPAQVLFIVAAAWAAVTLASPNSRMVSAGEGASPGMRDSHLAALAGGLAGVATAVKYTAVFTLLPALLAAALTTPREDPPRSFPRSSAWALSTIVLLAFVAAVATTNHFVWADFPNFVRQLSMEARHSAAQHHWASQKDPLWFYVKNLGRNGPGWILLALAAGYGIWGLGTARAAPLVLLAFPLPYLWFMTQKPLQFRRWVYPVAPIVAVAGAVALFAVVDEVRRWLSLGSRRGLQQSAHWLTAALVLAALMQPLWGGAVAMSQFMAPSTHDLVEEWLREHTAKGDHVLVEKDWLDLKGTMVRLNRVPRLRTVLRGGTYPLYYNQWVVVPKPDMNRPELERLRLAASFPAEDSFGGSEGYDFAVYAAPPMPPVQEAVDFALDQDAAKEYLEAEWPQPTAGSRGRQLPSEGARIYLPPLGYGATRLDIELEVNASADSLPEPIAVELEDETVKAEKVSTNGSRILWSSASIEARLLSPRILAVRLTPRVDGNTQVVRFAVRR
jgi:4-amino-4-deoxy-L-arabinose transferase-like glycosyltransferase